MFVDARRSRVCWWSCVNLLDGSKASECLLEGFGGGQEQTRLRSPCAPSMRPTGGQYLSRRRLRTGKAACSRGVRAVQSARCTCSAVCGALRSGLSSTVQSPRGDLRRSRRGWRSSRR